MDIPPPDQFFNVRGTMPASAPSYVKRKADDQLYEALMRNEYCFVLTSRQVGKSSLMTRTAVRMRGNKGGAAVVVLDVTSQGENLTPVQWYGGLLDQIGEQLRLEDELMDYWDEHGELGVLPRWMGAITRVALPALGQRSLVIFVDEVDFTRSLKFPTDEFFAGIRECHNRRTFEPELNRLTFCLVGSARPSDLIRDIRTTPFNIGQRIDLTDFTLEEALPLAKAMDGNPGQARALLERVLYWTGGHPYLTQQLCRAVADPSITTTRQVDAACERLFFSPRGRDNDDNLIFVRDRILKCDEDRAAVLDLYRKVLRGKPVKSADNNPLISVMRLSGILRLFEERVVIRNRIYRRVFDRKWVEANMPDQEKRRQRAAARRAVIRLAVPATIIVAVVSALAGIAMREAKQARLATESVRSVLALAYKSNGQFLGTTEYTGMSKATRELVVKAALDQLASLQGDQRIRNDRDLQLMVAGAYDTIGQVQLKLRDLNIAPPEDARASFQKALAIRNDLLKTGGNDVERLLMAQTLEDLGVVNSYSESSDTTEELRSARLKNAAKYLRESSKIREDEFNRHPNRQEDPSYAVFFARTSIALGDYLRANPQETGSFDSKSPGEFYRQAADCLAGLVSPPLRESDYETFIDRNAQLVELTHATALERQGSLLASNPITLKDGLSLLRKAADQSAARADFCKPHSQGNANERREGLSTSLDAAKKWLELARYENTAGQRADAKSDLHRAAAYLGVTLDATNAPAAVDDVSLKQRVPVNIEVRTCLAEVHEMMAAIYATEPSPAEASARGGCMGATTSWKLAAQERLVVHELNPENRDALNALAAAYLQYAHALYRSKGLRDAATTYDQVAELYKPDQTPRLQTARAALGIGNARRGMGYFTSARKHLLASLQEYETLEKADGSSELIRRGVGRALAALALNWANEAEYSKAERLYADAILIQRDLAPGKVSATDDPEMLEKRLELAISIARRAVVLGELGDPTSKPAFDEASKQLGELQSLRPEQPSAINDARLLELLIDGYLELARAGRSAKDWQRAAQSLDEAGKLSGLPQRDYQSVVGLTSDLEAMILRAEVSYNLYLNALGRNDTTAAERWKKLADQQEAYRNVDYVKRTRDPDNYRLTGQYMTMIRFAGLANIDSRVPASGGRDAESLLKDALQFREFIVNRYPHDVDVAGGIVESFEDLEEFYLHRNKLTEAADIRTKTIDAVKTMVVAKYEKDKGSVPKLSAEMALLKLYRGDEYKEQAASALKRAQDCAQVIREEYPDACRRWEEFRASYKQLD